MSISIKIIQRTDKLNLDNTAPIHLRLTQKTKSRYVSTGVTLPLDAWNADTQQINPDYPSAGELQFKVDSVRREYEKKIKRYQLYESDRENVMLKSETDHMENYLRLERLSSDGFDYKLERSGEMNRVLIPPMLPTSILRKTVGCAKNGDGEVFIEVYVGAADDGAVSLTCRITPAATEPDMESDLARLRFLYGERFSLTASRSLTATAVELKLSTK